tara:strand:- start:3000 stop:3734 length:735 start_codon:yes stop_codon:yes gene_type:complete
MKLPKLKKNLPLIVFIWFLIFTFLVGIGVCLSPKITKESMMNLLGSSNKDPIKDTFTDNSEGEENPQCPDVLIKQGSQLMLIHSKLPKSDSNPIYFETLDDYVMYVEEQRNSGLRCPVLFLQKENNTQGENVYRMRESPTELNGGFPVVPVQTPSLEPVKIGDASRSGNYFNKDMYPGFDSHGTYIGVYTTLDKIHEYTESGKISDNPMDTNWGGVLHSQSAVESGKYEDRVVGKPLMIPKVIA